MGDASQRWREQLAAWAIPREITDAVSDSPWVVPTGLFARRADSSVRTPGGASYHRAAEVPGQSTLDVGSGAGAASLPLGRPIIAVDTSADMLAALAQRAERLGLPVETIEGRWPDVADRTPVADVVVCHHVAYNVPELDAFAIALTTHARKRVVVELSATHPMRPLNPLWMLLHGLERPHGPTAEDAVAVLREVGISPVVETSPRPARPPYPSLDDLVAVTRQRLCLPASRDDELRQALLDLGVDPSDPQDLSAGAGDLVTLWWNT